MRLFSSRLDYSSVLLSVLLLTTTKNLQMVENAAAGILKLKPERFDHISPISASLYWLPIHVRSDFKVLHTPYKIGNGLAPSLSV